MTEWIAFFRRHREHWLEHPGSTPILILILLLLPTIAVSQDIDRVPVRGTPETVSTGQPPHFQALWGPTLGYEFREDRFSGRINLGADGELLLPQIGLARVAMEGIIGLAGSEFEGGVGAFVKFPYVNPGFEYNISRQNLYFKLTLLGAPRRGGLFGFGDRLRVDWIPATGLVQVGLAIEQPFGKYRRNRPKNRHTYLSREPMPEPIPTSADLLDEEAMAGILDAMTWIDAFMTPRFGLYDPASDKSRKKFDERAQVVKDHIRDTGKGFEAEEARYHAALDQAFSHAVSRRSGPEAELGAEVAQTARTILLDQVVIPVNQLFGQLKKPMDTSAYVNRAMFEFNLALGEFSMEPSERDATVEIFRRILDKVNTLAREAQERWGDSRLVWIPLNFGLRPEEFDTQAELNRIFERVLSTEFTGCNDIGYIFNDDFYHFYKNLILDTEHYAVTIIHDFRNRTGGETDEVAWSIVADGYMEAFIRAIEAMDRGERALLPEFILFLDEHYYRVQKARPIITFMERLYEAEPIGLQDEEIAARINRQQERLREAVENSTALARFGREYLRKNLKVHVNITYQFDPTFKEDALSRDHRKIAFRDIFEEDPASGLAVFTGAGVGEHYVGKSWEDRSLLLRGPDLVKLKSETRRLFLSQGFQADDVPFFLRERPFPPNYRTLCRNLSARGWTATVHTSMNQPGFLDKPASVAKITLYNLMRRGGVLLAPDSIWSSDFWASMFIAAAMRGVNVYAVSPSVAHAPSAGAPTMSLVRETLASMVRGSEVLGEEMENAGGSINVGVFDTDFDACSALDRVNAMLKPPGVQLQKSGFKMSPKVRTVLERERELLEKGAEEDVHLTDYGEDRKTKLHQKTQMYMSREAIEILNRPEWDAFLAPYLELLRDRCGPGDRAPEGVQPEWLGALESEGEDSDDTDRAAFVLLVGSHNQDRRSALLDGEVIVTVTGRETLVALLDFSFWLKLADWLDTSDQVDRYFPEQGGLLKSISRWIRNLI